MEIRPLTWFEGLANRTELAIKPKLQRGKVLSDALHSDQGRWAIDQGEGPLVESTGSRERERLDSSAPPLVVDPSASSPSSGPTAGRGLAGAAVRPYRRGHRPNTAGDHADNDHCHLFSSDRFLLISGEPPAAAPLHFLFCCRRKRPATEPPFDSTLSAQKSKKKTKENSPSRGKWARWPPIGRLLRRTSLEAGH